MKISTQFNRFFFGVVIKQIKELPQPLNYQNPFNGEMYEIDLSKVADDGIYQLFKLINPFYPKRGLVCGSTKNLSNKQMTKHIQWLERWIAFNGLELEYVSEEWNRILKDAGIEHE